MKLRIAIAIGIVGLLFFVVAFGYLIVDAWNATLLHTYWPAAGKWYAFDSSDAGDTAIVGAIFMGFSIYYQHSCKRSWKCIRPAKHEVHGTADKVCSHHHTIEDHQAVQAKHPEGRLAHGESPHIDGSGKITNTRSKP
jgi:Mn2+/Fe2+ NRAMP family transporter